jgi:DNA modification methylase
LKLAKHIQAKDELVMSAFHPRDAITKLLRRNEDLALAQLAKLEHTSVSRAVAPLGNEPENAPLLELTETPSSTNKESISFPVSKMLFKGDMLAVLGEWPAGCVDHIVCDPPYGIDVSMMQQNNVHGGIQDVDRIEDTHDVEDNLRLFELMLPLLYKVSRPHSFVVMWCDYMNFRFLHDLGVKAGFKVQRWPLVWHKTHSCINSFAGKNYTKNTEIAIVMRRENATLTKAQSSSLVTESNDLEQRMYGHPFVKPHNVWKFITFAVATQGQTILDPFAGVGSSLVSFITSGFVPLGIEIDDAHYNVALERLKHTYKTRYSNYQSISFT